MRSAQAVTAWIFDWLGFDVALTGDLLEECAEGRSIIWYWRQVLIAICIGIWRSISTHKIVVLRGVITGCAVNSIWLFLWEKFLPIGWSSMPRLSIDSMGSLLIMLLTQVATGWIVARTHRAHAIPIVFVFALWLLFWYIVGSVSDIGRLSMNSFDQPRFRPYLAWYVTPIFVEQIGLLVGALIATRPKVSVSQST